MKILLKNSHIIFKSGAMCFFVTFLVLLLGFGSPGYGKKVSYFSDTGEKIFGAKGRIIRYPQVLDEIITTIKGGKELTHLTILVHCGQDKGGKSLAQARATTLGDYFRRHLDRKIKIVEKGELSRIISPAEKKSLEQALKSMPALGKVNIDARTMLMSLLVADFVVISGEDGGQLFINEGASPIERVESRIESVEQPWQKDLLKRYIKVLRAMADMETHKNWWREEKPPGDCGRRPNLKCAQRSRIFVAKQLLHSLEYKLKELNLAIDLDQRVAAIAAEIVKNKIGTTAPSYDISIGKKALIAMKRAVKHARKNVKIQEEGVDGLDAFPECISHKYPCKGDFMGSLITTSHAYRLYAKYEHYFELRFFINDQKVRNQFVKKHLGLPTFGKPGAFILPVISTYFPKIFEKNVEKKIKTANYNRHKAGLGTLIFDEGVDDWRLPPRP